MQLCNNCIHQTVCGHRKKIEDWLGSKYGVLDENYLFGYKLDSTKLLEDMFSQITKHYQNVCKFYGAIK